MKVRCFRTLPLREGVEALTLTETSLPMEIVASEGIVGLEPSGAVPRNHQEDGIQPNRFRVRLSDGNVEECLGHLVYSRRRELIDFLATNYVPSGQGRIDSLLRSSPREEVRQRMGDLLDEREDDDDLPAFHRRRKKPGLDFVLSRSDLRSLPLERKSDRYFLTLMSGMSIVLAVEKEMAYGRHALPRRILLALHEKGRKEPACVWFDGKNYGYSETLKDLPPPLAEEVDECGWSHSGDAMGDPLPPLPTTPLFLLRAPSESEANAYRAKASAPGTFAPYPCPFFLLDTRAPVPIPEGLNVIDDVGESLAILDRVSRDVYVPRDLAGHAFKPANEPRWYLASKAGA